MTVKSNILVLDPAESYDLVTLNDVLLELGITNPTDNDKALIQKNITAVSIAISNYCDRVFPSERVEETIWELRNPNRHGGGGLYRHSYFYTPPATFMHHHHIESLYLRRFPITSIDSIYVDDIAITSDSNDLSLRIDRKDGVLYRLIDGYQSSWHFGKSIVATYTGGFTTIPADLQRAAIRWVEMTFFFAGQDSTVRQEQVYGIASISYDTTGGSTSGSGSTKTDAVPSEIKLLLDPYTRDWGFA